MTPSEGFTPGPRVDTEDGLSIATYDLGGDGPALLLAHATGFHGRMWLPVVARLRQHYHCIAFDERGHGQSAKSPGDDYPWQGFALDAQAVIEGWGLERPRAVGHSAGGTTLLMVEEARPGTFTSLYCYEPVLFPDVPAGLTSQNPLAVLTRRRRPSFASREEATANYTTKPPFSRFDPAAVRAYVEWGFEDLPDGTITLRCRREDEAAMYEMGPLTTAFSDLDRVTCPVTVACGDDGPHFGSKQIEAMAARILDARTEVLPGVGHFGPYERPDQVATSILSALAEMDRSESST